MPQHSKKVGTEIFLNATILPDGNGGFSVKPRKPVREVGSREAMLILGFKSLGSAYNLRDCPFASKYLKWRKLRPGRSRIVWEVDSLYAYLEATKELDK